MIGKDRLTAGQANARGVDVDVKSKVGHTPFTFASQVAGPSMIKVLLGSGSDPFAADETGMTAAHHMARTGSFLVDSSGCG